MIDLAVLRNDLAPFSDPATELSVTQGTSGIRIKLVRNGTDHDYFFDARDQSIMARHLRNKRYASLRSLLASSEFADIRGLTANQARMLRDFDPDTLIPPEGELNLARLTKPGLLRALASVKNQHLSAVLIDGPAGVGKTSLIQSFIVQRARRQADLSAAPPILHVTSRGRRLTGLNDALAQSLQLVRAKFTFDQTPTLIRHNLVQVAIDGFDELVDPEGYQDAWFALRDFFAEVRYGGPIILAGRDTLFDQQAFIAQAESAQPGIEVSHIRLQPVSASTAREWLKSRGWTQQSLDDAYTALILRPGSYALRPYFLSELADAKSWASIESRDLTPRAFLVENFLRREAQILEGRLGLGLEAIVSKLRVMFEEIALEMADNETEAVDLGFLQLATEIAFGDALDPRELAKLQHKAGGFALLEADAREGHRRFPHTEISHHFLSSAIITRLIRGDQIRFLRRGTLGADLLAIFGETLLRRPSESVVTFVDTAERIREREVSFDRLPENTAALLVSALSYPLPERIRSYSDLSLIDIVVFGVAGPARLERLKIHRLDVQEADLTSIEFFDCEVSNLVVDATTRFGTTRPYVHHLLHTDKAGKTQEVFEPTEIKKWIDAHSEHPPQGRVNAEALRLFERICRVMLRQHTIKEHPTDAFGRLLQMRYWPEIEEILFATGHMERTERRATAGAPATFLRMRDPFTVLVERDAPNIAELWKRIARIAE